MWNSKVLKTNAKNCFYMQLGNKKYKPWGRNIYLTLQQSKWEWDGGRGRKGEKVELKVLKTNVKNCFYMQLGNKIYRQWGIAIYFSYKKIEEMRIREGRAVIEGRTDWGKG